MRSKLQGFSLVEVLVTLAITAMLVAVLMNALYGLFRVQTALTQTVAQQELEKQALAWWRNAVEQTITYETRSAPKGFSGSSNSLSSDRSSEYGVKGSGSEVKLETSASLLPIYGSAPMRVHFSLKPQRSDSGDSVALQYADGNTPEQQITLHKFSVRSAEFRYFDAAGEEFAVWPPPKDLKALTPSLVMLKLSDSSTAAGMRVFLAAPRAAIWPVPAARSPFDTTTP
jgi:prepilin-type N-terminal cleavage/methylation domain-containing protein